MNVSIKQLNFFKNRILQQLEGIRGDIGELRYELYIKMVEACDNIDELKEMCELEMQIDFLNYTKGNIINKLEQENITVRELKEKFLLMMLSLWGFRMSEDKIST